MNTEGKFLAGSTGNRDPIALPEELRKRMEEVGNRLDNAERIKNRLRRELIAIMTEKGGFAVPKRVLVLPEWEAIDFGSNDIIEFKAEKHPDPEIGVAWSVRNRRIADAPRAKIFTGTVEEAKDEASLDELDIFLKAMNRVSAIGEGVGGIGALDSLMIHKKSGDPYYDDYTLYLIKDSAGRVIGAGCTHGENEQHASIPVIAIDPKFQSSGAGTAFLSELKKKYSSISLVPLPHTQTEHLTFNELDERLRTFYKRNGFVDARNWSRSQVSLSDETSAGTWQKLEYENTDLAFENYRVSMDGILPNIFEAILIDHVLQAQFPPEIIPKITEEQKARRECADLEKEYAQARNFYVAERRKQK